MTSLRELQTAFKAHLLDGDAAIADSVVSLDRDDGDERLGIYAHAYRARLRDVLSEEFSGLRALAGEAAFATLMDGYISAHPSRHPNIRWFGASMADWLADASAGGRSHPEYAAMARLDWALSTAFDAPPSCSVAADELAALTPAQWPSLRLHVSNLVQRLMLEWNVDAFRLAVDAETERPSLQRGTPAVVAVWRKDFGVRHRRLDADEALAFAAAADAATFGELCILLCEWHDLDAVAPRALFLLQRWIAAGWISAIDVDATADTST